MGTVIKQTEENNSSLEISLWELGIQEVIGHNLETKGRDEVNALLQQGWILLSVYTLKYKDDDQIWRERPMAILGKPNKEKYFQKKEK